MKSNNHNINSLKFSLNFKKILSIKNISVLEFGKMFFPNKNKSTIGYYYYKNPNITIYNLCKVAFLLQVDISVFFQDNLNYVKETNEKDLEDYYSRVLKNIGENIKYIRKNKADILLDIEIVTDIDSSNISKIENAKSNLSINTLTRIADTLETDVFYLLSWNERD